jgi:hypothetical protein
VTLEELGSRLEKLRSEGAQANAIVLLQTDRGTPVGIEREVAELVLGKGFRLAMVGANSSPVDGKTGNPDTGESQAPAGSPQNDPE